MLDHHRATAFAKQDATRLAAITGDATLLLRSGRRPGPSARQKLLGRAPDVRPWHPRWPDIRRLRQHLTEIAEGASVLIVADVPATIRGWLERVAARAGAASVTFLRTDSFETEEADPAPRRVFDSCLVLVPDLEPGDGMSAASNAATLVTAGGILLVAIGRIFLEDPSALHGTSAATGIGLTGDGFSLVGRQKIARGMMRARVQDSMIWHARTSVHQRSFAALLSLGAAAGLAAISLGCNFLVDRGKGSTSGDASSIFLIYRRAADRVIDVSSQQPSSVEAGSRARGRSGGGLRRAATPSLRSRRPGPYASPPGTMPTSYRSDTP
jgi:hypothetical protein